MRNQFKLVVLLVFVATYVTATTTEAPLEKQNEITKEEQHVEKAKNLIGALNPRLNKMILIPKDNHIDVSTKPEKSSKSAKSTEKKDESSTIGNENASECGKLITIIYLCSICSIQEW